MRQSQRRQISFCSKGLCVFTTLPGITCSGSCLSHVVEVKVACLPHMRCTWRSYKAKPCDSGGAHLAFRIYFSCFPYDLEVFVVARWDNKFVGLSNPVICFPFSLFFLFVNIKANVLRKANSFLIASFSFIYPQVSRSIGDVYLKKPDFHRDPIFQQYGNYVPMKRPVLSAEPSIVTRKLRPQDLFIIFASDGLWEQLSDEAAVQIVSKYPRAVSILFLLPHFIYD